MGCNDKSGLLYLSIQKEAYILNTQENNFPPNLRNKHHIWKKNKLKVPFAIFFKSELSQSVATHQYHVLSLFYLICWNSIFIEIMCAWKH